MKKSESTESKEQKDITKSYVKKEEGKYYIRVQHLKSP
jgi:hypothetical protein